MKMRWLGVFWAILGLTVLLAVITQKTAKDIQTHGKEQAFADLEREVLATSRLINVQVEGLSKDLQRAVAQISAHHDKSALGELSAAGLLRVDAQGQWEPEWLEISEELNGRINDLQLRAMIKDFPLANVGPLPAVFARIQDPTLTASFALLIPVKKPGSNEPLIALAIVPAATFSKWSEVFKGSDREVVVVDDHGFALALSEASYVGTLLDKHPLVSELLKSHPLTLKTESKNLRGQNVLGVAEKLDRTNLMVLVTRPFPEFSQMIADIALGNAIYWLAIVLLTSLLLWISLRPSAPVTIRVPVETPEHKVVEKVVSVPSQSPKTMDRNEAYQLVGPGLVQALRGPLSVILGHIQLAQAKSSDPKLQENLQAVEKESRRLRETLESLAKVSGVSTTQEPVKIEMKDVLTEALLAVRGALADQRIAVIQNLEAQGSLLAVSSQLKDVFVALFNNAAEAMTGCSEKELKITSSVSKGVFNVVIEDTGVGLSDEVERNLFQPFFTTKDKVEHAGLSLSMARGVLRGLGGDIRILPGDKIGVKVKVEIPVQIKEVAVPPPLAPSGAVSASPSKIPAAQSASAVSTPKVEVPPIIESLGGRLPLGDSEGLKMPIPPSMEGLTMLDEQDEEWQQLPRQIHVEESEINRDVIQIRKPKVRVKI